MPMKFGILFLVATMLLGCVHPKQARQDESTQNEQGKSGLTQVRQNVPQSEQDASKEPLQGDPQQARPDDLKQPQQGEPAAVDPLAKRRMQSRVFATSDEKMMLSSSAAVLKDLGFSLDQNRPELGFLTCSKGKMSENSKAAIAGQLGMAALRSLSGLAGMGGLLMGTVASLAISPALMKHDKGGEQIRAELVCSPTGEKGESVMIRLTLLRAVWHDNGTLRTAEPLLDPQIYQAFFNNLAQSISLEAQSL